jgi:hypothetical protein
MWHNLWSHALVDLGLSNAEFHALTPRLLDALSRRHQRRVEGHEFLFAQLTAGIVNSRPWLKEAVNIKDFMPTEMRKKFAARPKRINRKLVAAETRKFFASMRGK